MILLSTSFIINIESRCGIMIESELNKFFSSKSGEWDKMVAFSAKDIATMLHLPLSSVLKYMREGQLQTFKVGRHYRVTRLSLYRFIEDHECVVL